MSRYKLGGLVRAESGHTLHDTTERIQDGLRGEVLRRNEIDKVFLALLLLQSEQHEHGARGLDGQLNGEQTEAYLLDDVIDSGVGLLEVF